MDDDNDAGTTIVMEVGQVSITVASSAPWTPEMIDHVITRCRRQCVATVRQLGLVDAPDEATTP